MSPLPLSSIKRLSVILLTLVDSNFLGEWSPRKARELELSSRGKKSLIGVEVTSLLKWR